MSSVIMVWIQGNKRHKQRKIAAQAHKPPSNSVHKRHRPDRSKERCVLAEEIPSRNSWPLAQWLVADAQAKHQSLTIHEVALDGDLLSVEFSYERPSFLSRLFRKDQRVTPASVPSWALELMPSNDAQRYMAEWGAHLHQLIREGELRQARCDRRRLALTAVSLAIVLRVRRALSQAR